MRSNLWILFLVLSCMLIPELVLAQAGGIGGSGLETRIRSLTGDIVTVILPAISILGLVYSAILASTGDQSARPRMVLIIFASVIGMLAPLIISWLKSASGY